MRKAMLLAAFFLAALPLAAQEQKDKKVKHSIDLDEEFFHLPDSVTDAYLDETPLPKKARINDYWIVGVHGGVSIQHGYYNPTRQVSFYPNLPVYGFSITRFATMMNMFPNLGMELGFQHNYEGYNFKEYESDGYKYRQDIDGAYEAHMEVPEQGGVGLGFMLDPLEFHLGLQIKWGWSSFYQPDVASPYYYRFAYPLDGAVTFGVYYQLTKRHGHSRSALRKMARQYVAEERETNTQP